MKKPHEKGRTAFQLTLNNASGSSVKAEGEADQETVALLSRLAVLIQTRQITPEHPVFQALSHQNPDTV